jgi:putative tryptophan/tyrosine transport system substrate-binding protein
MDRQAAGLLPARARALEAVSIPIVAVASELAGSGFVESLARPGANVTGFSVIEFSVIGKMVETLRQLAPGVSRVGMTPVGAVYGRAFNAVAMQIGFQPIVCSVHGIADIERALANLAEYPNGGLIVPPDVTVIALATQVASLATRYRLPAIYSQSLYAAHGGLASYGPDLALIIPRIQSVRRHLRVDVVPNADQIPLTATSESGANGRSECESIRMNKRSRT